MGSTAAALRRVRAASSTSCACVFCHDLPMDGLKTLLDIVGQLWRYLAMLLGLFGLLTIGSWIIGAGTPTAGVAQIAAWADFYPAEVEKVTQSIHAWMTAPTRVNVVAWAALVLAIVCAICFLYAASETCKAQNKVNQARQWVAQAKRDQLGLYADSFMVHRPSKEALAATVDDAIKEAVDVTIESEDRASDMGAWQLSLGAVAWVSVAVAAEIGGWLVQGLWLLAGAFLVLIVLTYLGAAQSSAGAPDNDHRRRRYERRYVTRGLINTIGMFLLGLVALPWTIFMKLTRG